MQVRESSLHQRVLQGAITDVGGGSLGSRKSVRVERIKLVGQESGCWIRSQISCDLLRSKLVDAYLSRLKCGIRGLEFVPNLLPGHRFLRESALRQRRGHEET